VDDLFVDALDLQPKWSPSNTPEMQRRGLIIREKIPERIRRHGDALATAAGVPASDLGIEGRDGTGLKTEIPWVRIFSREAAPRATSGWYVVYLFCPDGDRFYLSLMQGTTVWTGKDFAPRKPAELEARVSWARPLIAVLLRERDDLQDEIKLEARKSRLAEGYELGTVAAIEYHRSMLPGESGLIEDLIYMSRLLGELYKAERTAAYVPGDMPPEVIEAEEAAAKAARRRTARATGQGTRLNAQERRAVELRSVAMATEYFQAQGWSVKDVGAKESYDLLLSKG
jgi:hypothetical protein